MKPVSEAQKKADRPFTYRDYLGWPEEERWELIDGVAYHMSPAPLRRHQEISANLFGQLFSQLEGHPCRAYYAPFDVRLPDREGQDDLEITTVVQPGVLIVCDRAKLDERGMRGAPDFIAELLSPFSMVKDLKKKSGLYERHRVPEYWAVNPSDEMVYVFLPEREKGQEALGTGSPEAGGEARADAGGFVYAEPLIYHKEGVVRLASVAGLVVDLERLFRA